MNSPPEVSRTQEEKFQTSMFLFIWHFYTFGFQLFQEDISSLRIIDLLYSTGDYVEIPRWTCIDDKYKMFTIMNEAIGNCTADSYCQGILVDKKNFHLCPIRSVYKEDKRNSIYQKFKGK